MMTLANLVRWLIDLYRAERRYVRAQASLTAGSPVTGVMLHKGSAMPLARTMTLNSTTHAVTWTCTHPKEWLQIVPNGAGYDAGDYDTVVCRCCGAVVEPNL